MNNKYDHFDDAQTPAGKDTRWQESDAKGGLPPKTETCPLTAYLVQLALGALNLQTEIGKEVSDHVRGCPSCTARVRGLEQAAEHMPEEELPLEESALGEFVHVPPREALGLEPASETVGAIFNKPLTTALTPSGEAAVAPAAAFPFALAATILLAIVGIGAAAVATGVVAYRRGLDVGREQEIARLQYAGGRPPLESHLQGWRFMGGDSVALEADINKELMERYEIKGKSSQDGWLFMLVRPIGEDVPWRVQNSGEALRVRRGASFMIPCEFGVEDKQFEVAAAVVSALKDWPYPAGQTLIGTIPRTADTIGPQKVTVTRGGPIPGRPISTQEGPLAEILGPKDGDKVSREPDFIGRLTAKDAGWPVVLVRPLVGHEPWYVQLEVENVGEHGWFGTTVYIGDDNTPPGTGFRVVVVLCSSREEASSRFKARMTIRSLPAELPMSEPITVIRQ